MSFPNRMPGVPQMTSMPQPGFLPYGVPMPPNMVPPVQPPLMQQSPWGVPLSQSMQYSVFREIPFSATTAFIGNIPECAPDCLIRQLAEKCGPVLNWKRTEGSNGKKHAFAFCDFKHPESTLCALRILDGYKVAGNPLVVKVNTKSRAQLEEYLRHKMPGVPIPKVESKPPLNADTAAIIVQFDMLLREYAGVLAGDPEAIRTMRIDAREARDVCSIDKKSKNDREDGSDGLRSRADSAAEEDEEQARIEREVREKEESYVNALRNWESRERKKRKDYEKELERNEERVKSLARDNKRRYEIMVSYDDDRDDSKYYRGSKWIQLVHAREREAEWDSRDRDREMAEIEEMRSSIIKRGGKHVEDRLLQFERAMVMRMDGEVVEEEEIVSTEEEEVEEDEFVKTEYPMEVEKEEKIEFTEVQAVGNEEIGFTAVKLASSSTENQKESKTTQSVIFENDEEEEMIVPEKIDKPKVDMTEHLKFVAAQEKKKLIQSIIDKIPTDPDELFRVDINWSVVDKDLINNRLRNWVNRKIIEYIGEEEPSLNDFICEKVMMRVSPAELVKDIWAILEQEAEVFVVKLWRLLVFETQSKIAGIENL